MVAMAGPQCPYKYSIELDSSLSKITRKEMQDTSDGLNGVCNNLLRLKNLLHHAL